VNFLTHGFRVTDDAVPATLIDLAARNVVDIEQRGPGVFYVRLREASTESLTSYERRVLDHLRECAHDGVVPAEALTTGPQKESARWMRGFVSGVVSDAQARRLSREAVGGAIFTVLTGAALVPAALTWVAWEFEAGVMVFVAGFALLGWIRRRHPQRETPAGMEAASRWLGVRASLTENPVFATHSPLEVELWDRLLAYGAALGVAAGASRPLPMGVESDTEAWTAYGGRWRRVRIAYPRYWPPGWGADPVVGVLVGLALVVGLGLLLYTAGPAFLDTGVFGAVPFAVACLGVVFGAALVVMAASDWRTAVEVTGPILRLRTFGDEDKSRYYVAVDDGESDVIRAWKVTWARYQGLEQGDVITARLTRNLCCVRWIVAAEDASAAG
jgi:membrane protein implicated in regulation of membrane protease activity